MSEQPHEPTPEYESTPDTAEPDPPEQPDDRQPPEPQQPADADNGHEGKVISLHTERGSLTLRPNQTTLDENQKMALVAIGIDVQSDPQVVPHVRAFMHMCQVKGLDPWAREAYLIGRGQGDRRKYTMQTGIDGYRKMAASTGRFIRVKDTLWTGQDDDDRTYFRDDHGVMRRVWWDQWPASRGYPGAAKVIVEHYDDAGNVVETEAVADWGMYAPFTDKWEWHPTQRGKKVYPTDPETGARIQELSDMWKKGYAHMLAKCAEALAYRKAFPARMSGIYTHEEMHRADQIERDRLAAQQREARQRAYAEATGRTSKPLAAAQQPPVPAQREPEGSAPSGPMPIADAVSDVVEDARPEPEAPEPEQRPETSTEQQAAWLHAELAWQSDLLGHPTSVLAGRQVRALRKNVEDFTVDELLATVASLRAACAAKLGEQGRVEDARAYADLAADAVVDVEHLFAVDGELVDPTENPALDADPEQPHAYVDDDGVCAVCGEVAKFGDDPLHPASP